MWVASYCVTSRIARAARECKWGLKEEERLAAFTRFALAAVHIETMLEITELAVRV